MKFCVCDASALAALSSVWRLDLLRLEFDRAFMPTAVFDEVVTNGQGWMAVEELQFELRRDDWIQRHAVGDSLVLRECREELGFSGEAEVIALAIELRANAFMDEMFGRRAATRRGLPVIGSLGILRRAKLAGRISLAEPLVRGMVEAGIYFSDKLLAQFLHELGERWTPG